MKNRLEKRILDILEWPLIEERLVSLCSSETAKRIAGRLKPVPENKIRMQMKKITAVKELISRGASPQISGIHDISSLTAIASKGGVLEKEDLFSVRAFTTSSERIRKYLGEHREEFTALEDEYSRVNPLPELNRLLLESLTDNGELNEDKFTILKKIRKDIFTTRQSLEKKVSRIIHSPDNEKVLQEKTYTTINGRFVILVKSGMRSRISGNVHDMSASGQTVYFEPSDLTELNNSLIMHEKELLLEIQKILAELTMSVAEYSGELDSNLRVLSYFDFITAASKFSIQTRSSEPVLSGEPMMKLSRAHHPMLQLMSPDTIVSNDVELGIDFNCLIISGANTGGKTVMLKTIGLCALFAMYGLHIPASPDSEIGIFGNIMADIGDDQNLSQSLSTFSGQLTIINNILKKADSRTLVIIDEIIVGTNPRQGAALSQAILEDMINTGSRIIVSTHYTELKELSANDRRFQNASVTFNLDTLKPTYELKIGIPGISYAVEIARNYGIPDRVLGRAQELVDSRESSVESLIEKVQRYEEEILEEREKVRLLNLSINEEQERIKKKKDDLEKLTADTKKGKGIEFLDELNRYREKISERITRLQELDQKDAGKLHEEIARIREEVSSKLSDESRERLSDTMEQIDPATAKRGDRVFISSIETEGVLEEIDGSGKSALVILGGSIKSRFQVKDLFHAGKAGSATKKSAPKRPAIKGTSDHEIPSTIQTSYNTIDLRGMRVEEALSVMDRELDRMDRNSIDIVIVIHGHGTGALKEAVREALKMNIYVRDFRHGDYGEGGDGVTVVRMR
ncbi:MAG TPA: endonuclease MutS2 [Spirochaetota bacterium]|nr:endonuclease MutS2 [Spirochaetota bacterium]